MLGSVSGANLSAKGMDTAPKSAKTPLKKAKGKAREKARGSETLLSQPEQEEEVARQHVGSRPEPEHRKGNLTRQPKVRLTSKPQGVTGGRRSDQ